MKHISKILILVVIFVMQPIRVSAEKLLINSIPIDLPSNYDSGTDLVLIDDADQTLTFSPNTNFFSISYFGANLMDSQRTAERTLLQSLGVTKNEACYLNVSLSADNPDYGSDEVVNYSPILSFCSSPTQQDLNDDKTVNAFDFAQCLADAEIANEAERAFDAMSRRGTFSISTGQTMESLYELDLACDFDVNRRIDALDLSKMIQVMQDSQ